MHLVGIDLGGTNIKVGIINDYYEMVIEKSIPTDVTRGSEAIMKDMAELALSLIKEKQLDMESIRGIGIGSPGIIDSKNGIVTYSNNFNWENIPLAKRIQEYTKLPVRISNDANCAAQGEVIAGAAKNCKNVILLTLGTGIGSGIIHNGIIFEGEHPGGGEIGHTTLIMDGEPCTCGRNGCFEAYGSATALINQGKSAATINKESILHKLCQGNLASLNGKMIFEGAALGDYVSKEVVSQYIRYVSEGIVNIINVFRPEKILLSGGICNQKENLTDPINDYIRQYCFGKEKVFIPTVECALLGNTAGMIGAAYLVRFVHLDKSCKSI